MQKINKKRPLIDFRFYHPFSEILRGVKDGVAISRSKQSDIPGFAWALERQIERLQTSRFAFFLFASGAIDGNLFADKLWRKGICDASPQNMCKKRATEIIRSKVKKK